MTPENRKAHIGKKLKKAGFKITPQRTAIMEYLMTSREHPSAETIYKELRKVYPSLSRNTVYEALESFERQRLVFDIIDRDGIRRYDAHTEPHIHLICLECGEIIDVPYDDRRILSKVKNQFIPEKSVFYIYGRCKNEKEAK